MRATPAAAPATARRSVLPTRALLRSAANKYCSRSLLPTETKSTRGMQRVELEQQARAPRSWRRASTLVGTAWPAPSQQIAARGRSSARAMSDLADRRHHRHHAGAARRPAAARSIARTCVRSSAGPVEATCGSRASPGPGSLPSAGAGRAAPCRRRRRGCGTRPACRRPRPTTGAIHLRLPLEARQASPKS